MRAKKAKRLRKEARIQSAGMPERQLLVRKHIKVLKANESIIRLQAYNDPNSTRGIYRALKKAA